MKVWVHCIAIVSGLGVSCGPPAGGTGINGFWSTPDAGPSLVISDFMGRLLWLPNHFVFKRISNGTQLDCSKYRRGSSGRVEGHDESYPQIEPVAAADGGWGLPLDTYFALMSWDENFRRGLGSQDAGPLVGSVEPFFTGTLVEVNDDLVEVDYRVDYRDSVRVVASEGAHLSLPRSDACK